MLLRHGLPPLTQLTCCTPLPPPPSPANPCQAELLVNITKHSLVPQHRILSREEKQTLLDRYKVGAGVRG